MKKYFQLITRTSIAMMLALICAVSVACFVGTKDSVVYAAGTEVAVKDGFLSQAFTDISEYRQSTYTAPEAPEGYEEYIFAGWYTNENCTAALGNTVTSGDAYAKFVEKAVLNVKTQVTAETDSESPSTNMRFVSTVDSRSYQEVGFRIQYEKSSGTAIKEDSSDTVFSRIRAYQDNGADVQYNPKAIHTSSQSFLTYTITGIPNANFETTFLAKAYWKTFDGTIVYGEPRYVQVADSYTEVVNIPVACTSQDELGTLTVKKGTDAATINNTRYVEGQSHGALMVAVEDRSELNSVTTYTVSDGSTAQYRNLETAYSGDGTADTSWYTENEDEDEFVIATSADLYGFAQLVNGGNNMKNKTIYLGADIQVNTVADGVVGRDYAWTPIGVESTAKFNGTFDGFGDTISGIYAAVTGSAKNDVYVGLFGFGDSYSVLQNFYLTDSSVSYIGTNYCATGSICGETYGTIKNVYSNATVSNTGAYLGGIVGRAQGNTLEAFIDGCWFDGIITYEYRDGGGIVGATNKGVVHITNCLNTGTLQSKKDLSNYAEFGGILGRTSDHQSANGTTNISNCLSAPKSVTVVDATTNGAIVGMHTTAGTGTKKLNIENCYATKTGNLTNVVGINGGNANVSALTYSSVEESAITGYQSYRGASNLGFQSRGVAGNWVVTADSTPGLAYFTENWIDVKWYYDDVNADSFSIYTEEQLYGFAEVSKQEEFANQTVKLEKDIVVNRGNASNWVAGKDTNGLREWTPINSASYSFGGTFDGNNHTISGIYMNLPTVTCSTGRGLFAQVKGYISNVKLENSYFNSDVNKTGSIVGYLFGSGSIENVYSDACVESTGMMTGGLVGQLFTDGAELVGFIKNSQFSGNVTSTNTITGGIVAQVTGTGTISVENCLFDGTVDNEYVATANSAISVGGMVGATTSQPKTFTVKDSISSGSISVLSSTATISGTETTLTNMAVAQIIGTTKCPTTLENVYTDVANTEIANYTNQNSSMNGLGAGSTNNSGKSIYGQAYIMSDADLSGENAYIYTDLDFVDSDNADGKWVAVTDKTPALKIFYNGDAATTDMNENQKISCTWLHNGAYRDGTGSTNKATQYSISNVGDMYGLAKLVNDGTELFSGKTVTLANDITFNNAEDGDAQAWKDRTKSVDGLRAWTPIGTSTSKLFKGTFEGNSHTISGIYLKANTAALGLFGYAGEKAIIQNIRLKNSYLVSTATGNADMGSIVGSIYNTLTLNNVYSDVIMDATGLRVGGIVGVINGTNTIDVSSESVGTTSITNCWYAGDINVAYKGSSAISCGGVYGNAQRLKNTLDSCLFTGDITVSFTDTSSSSRNYGAAVGGLCGKGDTLGSNAKEWSCVTIRNSLSAGEINFTCTADSTSTPTNIVRVGEVYGYIECPTNSSVSITYMAGNACSTITSSNKTVADIGEGAKASTVSAIVGDCIETDILGANAALTTALPFTGEGNTWLAVKGHVPVPSTMADVVTGEIAADDLIAQSTVWYTEGTGGTISTVADLYGFAQLSANGNTFANETISLAANIALNEADGEASDWGTNAPTLSWPGIGAKGKEFAGTFDGKDYTISGIYMQEQTSDYMGLFRRASSTSTISNLRLKNSYFEGSSNTTALGSIVGLSKGDMNDVYSNAVLKLEKIQIGGLIGRVETASTSSTTDSIIIQNCWFDGDITAGTGSQWTGGILGMLSGNATYVTDVKMKDVLFTGTITSNCTISGGLFTGGILGGTNAAMYELYITGALSAGTITSSTIQTKLGSVVGHFQGTEKTTDGVLTTPNSSKATLTNVFASRDCYPIAVNQNLDTYTDSNDNPVNAMTTTSTVYETSGQDRLVGYFDWDIATGDQKLDFANTWQLRKNGVPILKSFKDLVPSNMLAAHDSSAMAEEIGLDHFSDTASFTYESVAGGGDYLFNFATDATTMDTYHNKLKNELGFAWYASNSGTDMSTDGVKSWVYKRQADETAGEWVLNITYVAKDKKVYITANTDLDSVSANLKSVTQSGTEAVSLSMVEIVNNARYGSSFLFQLPNGHFIVNDGGMTEDAEVLIARMKKQVEEQTGDPVSANNPIYIDAWTITHYHTDHAGALGAFASDADLRENVYLEAVYASLPSAEGLNAYVATDVQETQSANYKHIVENAMRGAFTLTKADGSRPDVYQVHMGQRFYFNGLKMDIVQAQEQLPVSEWKKSSNGDRDNAASTNYLFTVEKSGEKSGEKILLGGDSTDLNMRYMMSAYGENNQTLSNINVFAAYHHGKNTTLDHSDKTGKTGTNEWTDFLCNNTNNESGWKFDVVFFPWYEKFDSDGSNYDQEQKGQIKNMTEINNYLKASERCVYHYTYGYDDYVKATYTAANPHGTVMITFGYDSISGDNISIETTSYYQGNVGTGSTEETE